MDTVADAFHRTLSTRARTRPGTRMLSRTAGYALHATVAIAEMERSGGPVRAAEVAAALDIPANYLAKILQALAREEILVSERGRTGGFRLARDPASIRLVEVVGGFDTLGPQRQCLLGRGTCSDVGGCPAHREWGEASAPAFRFFETRTVADLMDGHETPP
ncbi:MAG TPA: Rrf2 family transcriptional regulator [Longimicrobiales bacterium]|nr:Rrf2 family transcriptional regulator [Longimicrobiales bacterium]